MLVVIGLAVNRLAEVGEGERVQAMKPPATRLPSEAQTRGATRFSFILYGDTRGRHDGTAIRYERSMVMDGILAQIKKQRDSDSPIRFVLQTGDAGVHGQEAPMWNVSFNLFINRLTAEGTKSPFTQL